MNESSHASLPPLTGPPSVGISRMAGRLLRRPTSLAIVLALVLMAVFIFSRNAPAAALAALVVFILIAVYCLMSRPAAGMDVTEDEWRFFVGERRWRIPLDDLESVAVVNWDDRTRGLTITFRNGERDVLPAALAKEAEAAAAILAVRGVRVIR